MCEVKATFYHNNWWPAKSGNSTHYTCQIREEKIPQRNIAKITGTHKPDRSHDSVIGVRFDDCKEMEFVPTGISILLNKIVTNIS